MIKRFKTDKDQDLNLNLNKNHKKVLRIKNIFPKILAIIATHQKVIKKVQTQMLFI